ncbi:lipase family protein [Rhodococcus sp. G-MC3]|uniref:lipase family protein n=1 Tax=Rhodococcus sp. G-MC3 TaxID=3046209 RepID=UPI0024B968F3|nr:lipase family protein [Rhodococcus sp. G-MC3]MDJ0393423.1 lipase family protein [Rhodococcus sp. G-MC3]
MKAFRFTALCALTLTALVAAPAHADPLSDFYNSPVTDAAAAHEGQVLRSLRVGPPLGDGLGVNIERILYRSNDTHGDPTVVSGYTMTPIAPWPGLGPRPVVAYAPGTSGMADKCAGSAVLGTIGSSPAVLPLLLAGYSVAATDYQGLGTPGGHTYLNRLDAGHALLDVARAGVGDTGAPVVMFGYSEGGHAAGAAAELASSYAPELGIKGSYVGAPPADPSLNLANLDNTPLSAALLFSLGGLLNAYPEHAAEIRSQLNAEGQGALDESQGWCSTDRAATQTFDSRDLTVDGRTLGEHLAEAPSASLVQENTVGYGVPSAPVLLSQSVADDTVPIAQSRTLRDRWTAAGFTDLTYIEYSFPAIPLAGANHAPGGLAAYADVMPWIAGLLAAPPS